MYPGPGRKRHKIIIAAYVERRAHGYCRERPGSHVVRRAGAGSASDDRFWGHVWGNAVVLRKHVETLHGIRSQALYQRLGQPLIGHAVHGGSCGFFQGTDGSLDLRDMTVGGTNHDLDSMQLSFYRVILTITMNGL